MTPFNRRTTVFLLLLFGISAFLARPCAAAAGRVVRVDVKGVIGQGARDYIARGIRRAEAGDARALLITLDTPGGLLESTKDICTGMQNADVPVIVYVWPNGATATSAGFFLLMCADVAAMAPHTSTGSAHPVPGGEGEKFDDVMKEKVTNFSVEYMRSLTERRGRNAKFAERAVRRSVSITARNALKQKVIEIIAPTPAAALGRADGITFKKNQRTIKIRTRGAHIETAAMSLREKFLHIIGHPNIAYVLLTVGLYALIFEVTHPGGFIPGIVGVACLVTAFVSFSVLPVNAIGIFLIVAAFALFLLDVKLATHGLLAALATASFVLGSVFLIDSPDQAMRINPWLIFSVTASTVLLMGVALVYVLRTLRSRVVTGEQGMIGKTGTVKTDMAPRGRVLVRGELWSAVSTNKQNIPQGTKIRVVSLDGMELGVVPEEE